jgi:hypothetical protein
VPSSFYRGREGEVLDELARKLIERPDQLAFQRLLVRGLLSLLQMLLFLRLPLL